MNGSNEWQHTPELKCSCEKIPVNHSKVPILFPKKQDKFESCQPYL